MLNALSLGRRSFGILIFSKSIMPLTIPQAIDQNLLNGWIPLESSSYGEYQGLSEGFGGR